MILRKLEPFLVLECISLRLIRVADTVRSNSMSDVEEHLASEIASFVGITAFVV